MNTPKENSPTDQTKNKRYVFAQRQGDNFSCIKLTEGDYKNALESAKQTKKEWIYIIAYIMK